MSNQPDIRHSLIILTYTRADLVEQRIGEIARSYSSRPDVELLVFDNGSIGPNVRMAIMSSLGDVGGRVYAHSERIEENAGFGGGWNIAVEKSVGEIIHLISDDVRIYGDLIGKVEAIISKQADDNWMLGQTKVQRGGWNEFGGLNVPYLMGHYLAMPRSAWDSLGGFDNETFHPNDFEDVDLSYRASQSSIRLVATDLPIYHEVAGTLGYNPKRYEHTVKMRAAFASKWSLRNLPERP